MPPQSEANSGAPQNPPSENISNKGGGDVDTTFSSAAVATQKPVKKPTRQWAAWTRQEEESFFNALRQVGKNFEKITCRVQSKNKEQVRHYYYRLVRRMNKLLGPGFSLDAKNSKDTNAAMLRWWSLLEKYSCTASKLHLKPRRFKTFIETLAQQLLKDRNRTRRKRPYQGENCSIPMTAESIFSKPPGHDVHMVKLVFVDSQNSPKLGNTKLTSTKRGASAAVNVSKGEVSIMKTVNQKRRAVCGTASSAYKKWEKAAIAGVSLVADAAEHLERTSNDKNGSISQGTLDMLPPSNCTTNGKAYAGFSGDFAEPLVSTIPEGLCSQQPISETNTQSPMKLKLQLFPIDEVTRKALERDERNPHLELTLSARKRISSILEHLNRKWGNSSIASGELMLFPYSVQQDNLACCPRWTLKDSAASAGDVYAVVGSPAIFRLRYGWFSGPEHRSATAQLPSNVHPLGSCAQTKYIEEEDAIGSVNKDLTVERSSTVTQMPNQPISGLKFNSTSVGTAASPSDNIQRLGVADGLMLPKSRDVELLRQKVALPKLRVTDEEDDRALRRGDVASISAGEWADSLTNISVGDLLSEASRATDTCHNNSAWLGASLQHISLSCDSFDAAIAGLISRHQDSLNHSPRGASLASILDAEETCDEFSFHKVLAEDQPNGATVPPSASSAGSSRQITQAGSSGYRGFMQDSLAAVEHSGNPQREEDMDSAAPSDDDELTSDKKRDSARNSELTDFFWPDSLGPLDLDVPPARYQGQELLFGDGASLSGLSRLIASSLDAFQNCSFFGSEKKESSAAGEAQEAAPFLDQKGGSDT
ncbi:unnamed protein product [Spirodela intermedia]|uniref:Uncharacterized protein n=1 Tax=Spirodela intermedia TaxID=51605 RepID=A0A7I8LHM6_SPIIN|nr:unnamed protein product [Spirodela intermedia]